MPGSCSAGVETPGRDFGAFLFFEKKFGFFQTFPHKLSGTVRTNLKNRGPFLLKFQVSD